MAGKTFLVGLAVNWHHLTRYIIKHRSVMVTAFTAVGASPAEVAAMNAAFDAIVAFDAALKTTVGY